MEQSKPLVSLGPIFEEHLEWMLACRNKPEIRSWCRQVGLISLNEHLEWFHSLSGDKTRKMFVLSTKTEHVGVVGLTSIDYVSRRAEFSIWIDPSYQGRGYAIAGLKAICNFGFRELGLNCIWGESFAGNPGIGIWKRVGFKEDCVRRDFYYKNGEFVNAHLCSLLREEWKKLDWQLQAY